MSTAGAVDRGAGPRAERPSELLTLEAQVEGRFHVLRPTAGAAPHPILVGFHGYGENATRHLAELTHIPGIERWLVVAVEALHAFYDRKTGEVVRSWMTKEGRERAIADNVRFIGAVLARARAIAGRPSPLVLAGFSQGTAMAWRAAALAGQPATAVVALGGDLPPDVAELAGPPSPRALLGRGRTDGWYTAEKLERDRATLTAHGVAVECFEFDGGHEWTAAFHARAGELLAGL